MKNIAKFYEQEEPIVEAPDEELFLIGWREVDQKPSNIMGEGLNEFWNDDATYDDIANAMPSEKGYVFMLANRPGDVIYHADAERAKEAYKWYDEEGYAPFWFVEPKDDKAKEAEAQSDT